MEKEKEKGKKKTKTPQKWTKMASQIANELDITSSVM